MELSAVTEPSLLNNPNKKPDSENFPNPLPASDFTPTVPIVTSPPLLPSNSAGNLPVPRSPSQHSFRENSSTKAGNYRRPNWTTSEDEELCRSWLENSLDPLTNTIHKGTHFWSRVADDFANRFPGPIRRNKDHVRNRWQLLQAKVVKFATYFATVQGLFPTGKTQDELVGDAMRMYEREESHKFTFYSSWLILRNSPRWLQWSSSNGASHKRFSVANLLSSSQSSTGHSNGPSRCPAAFSAADIAVSPHSTVSLLDSDESPTMVEQPLNRLIPRKFSFNRATSHSPLTAANGTHDPKEPSQPAHRSHQRPITTTPEMNSTGIGLAAPSTDPPTFGVERKRTERSEEAERLMALAIKRKADVQEAALEVQLLNIDPDQIKHPLRKEIYMMKMEEIRDRYRAKRSRSSSSTNHANYPEADQSGSIAHPRQSPPKLPSPQPPKANSQGFVLIAPSSPGRLASSSQPPSIMPASSSNPNIQLIDQSTTHPALLSQDELTISYQTSAPS